MPSTSSFTVASAFTNSALPSPYLRRIQSVRRYFRFLDVPIATRVGAKIGADDRVATIPMHACQERHYQLSIRLQVGSEFTYCQFVTVRTMQEVGVVLPYR